MGRSRRLDDLRGDVRRRADIESATDRHPDADLTRYINQGRAELYDLLVAARGRSYFRKSPAQTIATVEGSTRYTLEPDFYRLISVRLEGDGGYMLHSFSPQDEALLRAPSGAIDRPTHYELQAAYIELLPAHKSGHTVVVEYVPVITDLTNDAHEADGINGWEEYVVDFAARCVAVKDEEWALVQSLDADMAKLRTRISGLAPKRDAFRAERVKDVRGGRLRWPLGRRW